LFGTIQDISDRVLAEEQARASEERLRRAMLRLTDLRDAERLLHAIVETAKDLLDAEYAAIGVVEPGGTAFERFIHAGMEEETVRLIGDLPQGRGVLGAVVTTRAPLRLEDLCSHAAAVGFPAHHPSMRSFLGVPMVYRDLVLGHLYLTNKRGRPFDADDEQLASALAGQAAVAIENARIIEQEQEIGERLRALNDARTDFVATVSHELRTPVAVILGLSETLLRNRAKLSDEEAEDALERIARQAERLSRLVADVLELSRLDAGRLEVRPAPIDMRQAAEEALAVIPAPEGCTVGIEVPSGLVAIADELRFEQVLVNLLTNAYRYGGPNVVIEGSEEGGEIVMRVRDDGSGVPARLLPTLFERFNRGANVPPGGTGLGLAIAKGFIDAFGGSIRYMGGNGATFEIRLPRAEPA
jgi:signal transduction histidine kinase